MSKLASFSGAMMAAALAACSGSRAVDDFARVAGAPVNAVWQDGRLHIDVPVPVVTFGLPADSVAALKNELQPFIVDHITGDLTQTIPPDADDAQQADPFAVTPGFGESITLPMLPTAHYQVTAANPALEQQLIAALAAAQLENNLYDAVRIEDFLASVLPLHADNPTIVVLHLSALGVRAHAWKVQGHTGFLAPVRVFGERHPLVVLDPSASLDSFAGSGGYRSPTGSSNSAEIARFVRDATEFRVLQGSVYPVSLAPCHAVTGVFGIRDNTSPGELLLRKARDAFNAQRVKAGWDHLTGTDVFFDLKVLSLPVDDPVLDALARGEFPAFEVMRGYLSVMFEQYHVEHPGCEEYLSVVFAGDVATVPGGGVLGIGTYDDSPGQRISMSWVHELFRFTFDPESPLYINGLGRNKDLLNWWEYLFSHETGHILGQRHPHDINRTNPDFDEGLLGASSNAFSSIWSSMSYQQDGRVIDFGKIDANNWRRNRAGFALALAAQDGREGSPEWNRALDAARLLNWQGVWEALQR